MNRNPMKAFKVVFELKGLTMKAANLTWAVILLAVSFVPTLSAQEVVTGNDVTVGARAQGMGSAQIAASEDVTAVVNNPADLARIRNLEVQLGLLLLEKNVKTDIKSEFMNGSGSATKNFTELGSIGIAYPVLTDRGSLVFALAYNRVKDFNGIFKNCLDIRV